MSNIKSFAATKVRDQLRSIWSETFGLDSLLDIQKVMRDVQHQVSTNSQVVLSFVLNQKCLRLLERFDGEPMTVVEAELVCKSLKGPILEAVEILLSEGASADSVMIAAAKVIAL